ncbi:MAG: hypothetical protein HYR56_17640 [Acidobacteria bacterium]|nr:hypothetical protein [Acidobacteriota bacterium]MBI3426530.1 hypothetical protein [Acidobacteriota bacterium]
MRTALQVQKLFLCGLLFSTLGVGGACLKVQAQTAETQTGAEEQNETFRDTLVRMRIKREEEEHKKIVAKAEQIQDLSEKLSQATTAAHLPRANDKHLKEIEKNARSIRSDAGGGEDEPLETPPHTLADTLKQLSDASERLNKELSKTSRQVVSITVASQATEVIQLVKLLRGYLN